MKKIFFTVFILAMAGAAFAVPYASQIRVGDASITQGQNQTITYYINEAGGAAVIKIIKVSDSSEVASFSGTATQGLNTVIWNGRVDNAGGALVPIGNYRVKIIVTASKAPGWVEIASNSSLGGYATPATMIQTIWDGFSGMEIVIPADPNKDSFGYILCSTSANVAPENHGHVVFNPDLSCEDGGDGQSMWLKYGGTFVSGTDYTICWGNCVDPDDSDYIWVAGQSVFATHGGFMVMYGKYNDLNAADACGGFSVLDNARDIAVVKEGGTKYAYITIGNDIIYKSAITGNQLSGTPVDIVLCSTATRYGKGVDFDSAGNLYWSTRRTSTSNTLGAIYRWNAATVQVAAAGSLNEANADWDIQFPTGALNVEGVAISPAGDVYAAASGDGDGTVRGIYYLGNASTPLNKKTLGPSDRIIAYPYNLSTYAGGIQADYAGNVLFVNRSTEEIRAYGPGGDTSKAIVAPPSQNFEIQSLPLAAQNWALYE